jgi:hypothetical protein
MRRIAGWREKDPFGLADGEVRRPTALGDFNPAPGAIGIEEDEQVGGAVAPVFAVVTLDLPGRARDRLVHLADELDRTLVEADHRPLWVASAPPATGRDGHAGILPRQSSFGSPDGADTRTSWLHQRTAKGPPSHPGPHRSEPTARTNLSLRIQHVRITVPRH